MDEAFEAGVERIAKAWYEQPCPPEDGPHCNPGMHDWDRAHAESKAHALDIVRFVLNEAGIA